MRCALDGVPTQGVLRGSAEVSWPWGTMRWRQLGHAQPSTSKTRWRSHAHGSQRRRASFERRSGRQSLGSTSQTEPWPGL